MEITIVDRQLGSDGLIEALERTPGWLPGEVRLELRKHDTGFRTLDPTIVVAIINSVGGLGVLISGLLGIASRAKRTHIAIRDKDGRSIEVDGTQAELAVPQLIEDIRKMERPEIEVTEK